MKIEINKLPSTKEIVIDENLTLDTEQFPPIFPLQEIGEIHASAKVRKYEDFINVNLNIKADSTLICSYTLKPFKEAIKNSENFTFTFSEEDSDEDMILIKGTLLDLDQYIYDLVVSGTPMKPVMPNAKLPKEGKGYRILNSDELAKEKAEQGNSAFDKLKDLDLD